MRTLSHSIVAEPSDRIKVRVTDDDLDTLPVVSIWLGNTAIYMNVQQLDALHLDIVATQHELDERKTDES